MCSQRILNVIKVTICFNGAYFKSKEGPPQGSTSEADAKQHQLPVAIFINNILAAWF